MSKRRELRQLLLHARVAIPASPENEDLLGQIDEAMRTLRGPADVARQARELKVPPPTRREPPAAIVQFRLFPHTEEVCYNGLMFDDPGAFWRYVMRQGQAHSAFQHTFRNHHYQAPAEVRDFLAKGGKIQRVEQKVPLTSASHKTAAELDL